MRSAIGLANSLTLKWMKTSREPHDTVLGAPLVERSVAEAVSPAQLLDCHASLGLLQEPYDLLVGKSALPHVRSFLRKRTLLTVSWYGLRGAGQRREPPRFVRQPGRPFTCPPFEPTAEQLGNLERLAVIVCSWGETAGDAARRSVRGLELAELWREQGRFEDAEAALKAECADEADVTRKLIAALIAERLAAPVRYML